MGVKLGKGEFPNGSSANDFQCFGPPAIKDGEFDSVKIADLGCFTQDGKDSNKYYHAAICQHKTSKKWYVYFEWGRTGATKPDCQFVQCDDEADAQDEFASQLHSKNDKRGEWAKIAGLNTLRAKAGKDCYLVRPQATRSTGLPDARTIKSNDGAKSVPIVANKGVSKPVKNVDPQTLKLMRDLSVATVAYAKGAMASGALPTQVTIDEGNTILTEALKRLKIVGDDIDDQVNDNDLKDLTNVLYGKIPKVKPVGAGPETWVLSKNNITLWRQDLDAFESALYSGNAIEASTDDPFDGMPLDMCWIDPKSPKGAWLYDWAPNATRNRHGGVGAMKIHNLWEVSRHGDHDRVNASMAKIAKENKGLHKEKPFHQSRRPDVSPEVSSDYKNSNSALLFHGTRSVNCSGILRKGLMLPKQLVGVAINGAMYGPGLYWADDWKKSAGYTSLTSGYYSAGSGAIRGRHAFMFFADVVLGNPYVAPGCGGWTSAPSGHHCVFGKAGSAVANNEFIVYKTEQHALRYLIEFTA
jgi:predicted DNA-binding WGR domain protein